MQGPKYMKMKTWSNLSGQILTKPTPKTDLFGNRLLNYHMSERLSNYHMLSKVFEITIDD